MSQAFNTFDLIFIAAGVIFILIAFFRGFIKEISSLIIWLLSLAVSYFLAPILAKFLSSYSSNKVVLNAVCAFILFVATYIILIFSTADFVNNLKEKMPSMFDRSLGVFYAIFKTLIIFAIFYSVLTNIYSQIVVNKDEKKVPVWLSEARFGNIIKLSSEIVDPAVSAFMNSYTKNLVKGLEKNNPKIEEKNLLNDQENKVDSETGYDKKTIQKLDHLIDVINDQNINN
jgi:membrane protein required for colicin V production